VANVKRALELCETSLPLAVSSGDRKLEARAIMVLGRIYQVTAPARALRHFEQSISISRETKDRVAEAWCLLYLGKTHHNLRDAKAAYMIESALTVANDLNLVFLKCKALMNLGINYAELGEYIIAIGITSPFYSGLFSSLIAEKLAEGMKLARNANIKSTEAEILYNLGQCYESAQNSQLAFKYYSRANSILDNADDFVLHAKVLASLGLVCLKLEKARDSNQHLLRSMPLLDKLGDKLIQVFVCVDLQQI
jgi:tetratricopeptide (TPR) repeat protein